jgi:hypothetical protein
MTFEALAISSLLFLAPSAVLAQDGASPVTPTTQLTNPDGSWAGFATSEAGVYFVVSSSWRSDPEAGIGSATLAAADADAYDLRLTLQPDYSAAAPAVAQLKAADFKTLFFPLPSTPLEVSLFLPEELGAIQAYLVPDVGVSNSLALYYRLRFSAEQLEVLRQLARGGVTLQGAISYEYPTELGTQVTSAPLTVRVPEATLDTLDDSEPDSTIWLRDLLDDRELSVPSALDGRYALGSGISVSIRDSTLHGRVLAGSYQLQDESPMIRIVANEGAASFSARITFRVPELNLNIQADYRAQLTAQLDLSLMSFSVERLVATQVTIGGADNPFYKRLIDQLTAQPKFTRLVSNELTDQLQRRILSQTLFGLEGLL